MRRALTALLLAGAVVVGGSCGGGTAEDGSDEDAPADVAAGPESTSTSATTASDVGRDGSSKELVAVRPVAAPPGSPPCGAEQVATADGVACYSLGPIAIDGDDIAWAVRDTANQSTSGGQAALRLHLTAEGLERFNVLAAEAVGKQVAFVIDGAVVSAPIVQQPVFEADITMVGPSEEQIARIVAAFPKPPGS